MDKLLALRMRQQERLLASPALTLHSFVPESILHQSTVDRAQITLLLERADLPNITFQIVPPQLVHEGLQGSVILLSFNDPAESDIAFADTPLGMTESQHPKRVATITRILNQLTSLALSPDDSRTLLTTRQ